MGLARIEVPAATVTVTSLPILMLSPTLLVRISTTNLRAFSAQERGRTRAPKPHGMLFSQLEEIDRLTGVSPCLPQPESGRGLFRLACRLVSTPAQAFENQR